MAWYAHSFMPASAQVLPLGFSLLALLCWGTSDFLGGFSSRSANAFLVTAITHGSGLVLVTTVALAAVSPHPGKSAVLWALAAGACGGAALGLFYRALSRGNMGLTAPVAAVLSAAIPTAFGMLTEGLPKPLQIAGFVLAGVGIWLISRTEGNQSPAGLGMAALAGIGFAAFYLFIKQAGSGSALWLAAISRAGALLATLAIVFLVRARGPVPRFAAGFAAVAGCLDVSGSVFYIRATQTGRLDTAVVLASLYPVMTVVLARIILKEEFTNWKKLGMLAALAAVPLIAS